MWETITKGLYKAGHALAVVVYSLVMQTRYWKHRVAGELNIDWSAIHFNRIAILNLILSQRPDSRYLEIGCAGNVAFDAVIASDKTGVDPASGGTHRMTSDAFFATTNDTYDVIFIDGLHTYAQVRNDVLHALKRLNPGGWIVLHDLFPRSWKEEHVPCLHETWTGDVWKVAFELHQARHLEFILIQTDMGVGIVRPTGDVPTELPDLSATLNRERFFYFLQHHQELPLRDAASGRQWILDRLQHVAIS